MREDFFEFERTHTTVLVTNNRPVVRESKFAVWRRLKVVPFSVTIPPENQDRKLLQTLHGEQSGILRWAVEGCAKWQSNGQLCFPSDVEEATDAYRDEQDVLEPFIEDRCIFGRELRVTRADLWEAYTEWCKRAGERYPLDRTALYERFRQKGHEDASFREHGERTRGFKGLGLTDQGVTPSQGVTPFSR